jgi:hypothetical protein
MEPAISLLISVVVTLLLMTRIPIGIAVFIGSAILGFLVYGYDAVNIIISSLISAYTIKIVVIVIFAFTLGYSMEFFGILNNLTTSISNIFGGLSFLILPLLVGLLPMPGGALISAVMLLPLVKKYMLSPEKATFLNYWYRHIWVTVWPIYPNVIIGAAVLGVSYIDFIHATAPIALVALLSGLIWCRGIEMKFNPNANDLKTSLLAMYPILLVALLSLLLKIDLILTLPIVVLILFVQYRVKVRDLKEIFKKTIDLKIIILVFAVMTYKTIISMSGAAEDLFLILQNYSIPLSLAVFAISFLVGFATGVEMSYTSIALPLFLSFVTPGSLIPENLMLLVLAGFAGVMLSPLHLCYVLSADYFKAEIGKSYRLLVPPALFLISVVVILYLF